jgi:hypothetical protein
MDLIFPKFLLLELSISGENVYGASNNGSILHRIDITAPYGSQILYYNVIQDYNFLKSRNMKSFNVKLLD